MKTTGWHYHVCQGLEHDNEIANPASPYVGGATLFPYLSYCRSGA
jgi:hypothetical protein